MRDHPNDYIIENATIPSLTLSLLLNHCTEAINTGRRSFFEIQAVTIEVNYGLFTNTSPVIDFPTVSVSQLHQTLVLSCPCATSKRKLCEHQAQVLYNIMDRPYLRIFYDQDLRSKKLQEAARDYGMENEKELDDFFELDYHNRLVSVKPRLKRSMSMRYSKIFHFSNP